jgi:plasmid stabilization system protein ParE
VRDVFWSQAAFDDLDAAIDHVAADNSAAALRVLDRIINTAASLGDVPTGRRGRVTGICEKVVVRLPYIIAYALQSPPSGRERVVFFESFTARGSGWKVNGPNEQL